MVTNFTCQECNDIIKPLLWTALPVLGVNQHFTHNMVYSHNDQYNYQYPIYMIPKTTNIL